MKKTKICRGNTYWKGRPMHPFFVVAVVVAICSTGVFFLIRLISAHAFSLFSDGKGLRYLIPNVHAIRAAKLF